MPPSKSFRSLLREERGSASLEFVTAGTLLLVPLVYLVLALSAIQAGSFAAEGAARQAARVFVVAGDEATAFERAELAVRFALSDYGLEPGAAEVTISCSPRPDACLTRDGTVTVTVSTVVALPFAPPALDVNAPLTVPLQAASTQQVSRFAGER